MIFKNKNINCEQFVFLFCPFLIWILFSFILHWTNINSLGILEQIQLWRVLLWIEHVTWMESYMNYLMRYPSIAIISQPVTQKYSIPIPTIVLHLPPTKIFRLKHRLITIQIEPTLDVVFSRFRGFSFTIILRQKPRVVRTGSLSLSVL